MSVLLGDEPGGPWLWQLHNEHRFPLPRIVYLGLYRLTGDLRAGCYVSFLGMSLLAAGLMHLARTRPRPGGRGGRGVPALAHAHGAGGEPVHGLPDVLHAGGRAGGGMVGGHRLGPRLPVPLSPASGGEGLGVRGVLAWTTTSLPTPRASPLTPGPSPPEAGGEGRKSAAALLLGILLLTCGAAGLVLRRRGRRVGPVSRHPRANAPLAAPRSPRRSSASPPATSPCTSRATSAHTITRRAPASWNPSASGCRPRRWRSAPRARGCGRSSASAS